MCKALSSLTLFVALVVGQTADLRAWGAGDEGEVGSEIRIESIEAGDARIASRELRGLIRDLARGSRLRIVRGARMSLIRTRNDVTWTPSVTLTLPSVLTPSESVELADQLQSWLNELMLESILQRKGITEATIVEHYGRLARLQRRLAVYRELRSAGYSNPQLEPLLRADLRALKEAAQRLSRATVASGALWESYLKQTFLSVANQSQQALVALRIRNDVAIPTGYRGRVDAEQRRNDLGRIEYYHSPGLTDLMVPLRPQEGNVFELPYVLLTRAEARILGDQALPKDLLENGRIRFFIHPQSLEYYRRLIMTHPLVYGGFMATAFSSSRSLLVWKDDRVFSLKTGLDSTIGKLPRLLPPDEALHATMISEGLGEIPRAYFRKLGMVPLLEPSVVLAKGYESALIVKATGYADASAGEFEPMFALYSSGNGESELQALARTAGKSPLAFAEQDVIRPVVDALARLYADYGFIPEPHGQNLYYRARNGRIVQFAFADMSGVAVDLELRTLRGLDNSFVERERKAQKDIFRAQYHDDRGASYLERGIEAHFVEGLLEGFIWDLTAAEPLGSPLTAKISKELADFSRRAFEDAFSRATGQALVVGGKWPERVRASVHAQVQGAFLGCVAREVVRLSGASAR